MVSVQEFYCQMRLGKQMELVEQNVSSSSIVDAMPSSPSVQG